MSVSPRSLSTRLLLASALLLPVVLGMTGWYLERAHRSALNAATIERLQIQVIALLAQAEVGNDFQMPLLPLEPRLAQVNSGLYAMVTGPKDSLLWLSPSANLLPTPVRTLSAEIPALRGGESHDSELDGLFRHAYQVVWEVGPGDEQALRFMVAETTSPRDADVALFRQQLMMWLGTSALLLLLAQLLIVRWGLRPLATLGTAIERIESGESQDLSGPWPPEVQPVANNLQSLLTGEQQRRGRLRNTLADLAHSLKTPLAVLRGLDPSASNYGTIRDEQLARMEEVIGWQLQRASGRQGRLLQRTPIAPVLARLRATLLKVYADRGLAIEVLCPAEAQFQGDERDLMELLGNLLDNACKYGHHRVIVAVSMGSESKQLAIQIEDDGDGISPELRDALLHRGMRADNRSEGQGIGLALVMEIVQASGGELIIGQSKLGGAAITLTI